VFKGDKPLLLPQELRSNKLMLFISVGEKTSAVIDEDYHVYTWGIVNN
jgi:alpha-tubulin suppressor-like RCC1 family protein